MVNITLLRLRFMLDLQIPFYRLEPLIFQYYLINIT